MSRAAVAPLTEESRKPSLPNVFMKFHMRCTNFTQPENIVVRGC